jgi:hypothetical protein
LEFQEGAIPLDELLGFGGKYRRTGCIERAFGWMVRWRRLVRDYEQRADVSEATTHVVMGRLLRRTAHP